MRAASSSVRQWDGLALAAGSRASFLPRNSARSFSFSASRSSASAAAASLRAAASSHRRVFSSSGRPRIFSTVLNTMNAPKTASAMVAINTYWFSLSEGNQVYVTSDSLTILNFCCYANGAGDIGGSGTLAVQDCISANPQFRNAGSGDYHLKATSPCIDNGENALVPGGVTTDLDGNTRIVNADVDLGPYEEQE